METITVDSDKTTYNDIVSWIQSKCGEVDSPTLWVRADKPETVRDLIMFYSHNNSGTATNYSAVVYGTLSGAYVIAPLASTRFAPLSAGTKFNVYRMA